MLRYKYNDRYDIKLMKQQNEAVLTHVNIICYIHCTGTNWCMICVYLCSISTP